MLVRKEQSIMRNLSSPLHFQSPLNSKTSPLTSREQVIRAAYNAYPRHVGKRQALKAFDRALYRLEFEEKDDIPPAFWKMANGLTTSDFLIEKIRIFAFSPAGKKGNFTPHPATWANQSRYLDDVTDWFQVDGEKGEQNVSKRDQDFAAAIERSREADRPDEGLFQFPSRSGA